MFVCVCVSICMYINLRNGVSTHIMIEFCLISPPWNSILHFYVDCSKISLKYFNSGSATRVFESANVFGK